MPARPRPSISTASCATTICACSPEQGDLQINLSAQGRARARQPRDRARRPPAARRLCRLPEGTAVKVVEVPPGPPVLGTLLAEIYGPDAETRRAVADEGARGFPERARSSSTSTTASSKPADRVCASRSTRTTSSSTGSRSRRRLRHDRRLIGGVTVGFSQRGGGRQADRDRVQLPEARHALRRTHCSRRRCPPAAARRQGAIVELGDVVKVKREPRLLPDLPAQRPLRRDGAWRELAGRFEAPIYGMLAVEDAIAKIDWGSRRARDPLSRPAGRRIASRRCCGTANGRSPM